MLSLKYKNQAGEICFSGGGDSPLRITAINGLSLAEREYTSASYAGYDGQETVSARFLPRTITISGDVLSVCARDVLRNMINVLADGGYLYITDGDVRRRIFCNQTIFPDAERILRGKLATFAVQFVCDNPFFEDAEDTELALYRRTKNLASPFALPIMFGETVAGATIFVDGRGGIEPIITLHFSKDIESESAIMISNITTGETIELKHSPVSGEEITIDIKNRTAISSVSGNVLKSLTDESFLGRFMLEAGKNEISVSAGAVTLGITVKCTYNNKFLECVVI